MKKMLQKNKAGLKVSITVTISAIYTVLTLFLGEFGYSWIQVRISEALTPLPWLFGFPAVIGLTLGCALTNWFSPIGLPDLVFGPILTFSAAILSWKANFGKKSIACIYPVLVNAFGVSAYVSSFYGVPYTLSVVTIAAGEFIAAVLIGYPLLAAVEKRVMGLWVSSSDAETSVS